MTLIIGEYVYSFDVGFDHLTKRVKGVDFLRKESRNNTLKFYYIKIVVLIPYLS